ncbi:hypothetical protein CPLU01_09176 [Colletotrichum plurivorum]|uniref:Uncharacterized protein n=1 Tax=Colletotrichum plurivorum TaxID=2175906 RepID=A0A8H6NBH7_9PEZI|nr:hypothetical protein CPLU01_09176 [Colletotrichum plurivorum]
MDAQHTPLSDATTCRGVDFTPYHSSNTRYQRRPGYWKLKPTNSYEQLCLIPMEIIAKSQVLNVGLSSPRGSSDESFSSESEFGTDVWEGLTAFDFAPEEWRPRRPWDAIDDEDMEEDRHLQDIL